MSSICCFVIKYLSCILKDQFLQGYMGLSRCPSGKESAYQCRRHQRQELDPWVGKIHCSRKWQPTLVFLPKKFQGQRSLSGYSPWGCRELDMTEHTCTAHSTCKWAQMNGIGLHGSQSGENSLPPKPTPLLSSEYKREALPQGCSCCLLTDT